MQASSTTDNDQQARNTTMEPNFDTDTVESPIVTSLTTPYPQPSGSVRVRNHVVSLRKIQEQEQEIKRQQRKIQELEFSMAITNAHTLNIKQSEKIPLTPSQIPHPPDLTDSN